MFSSVKAFFPLIPNICPKHSSSNSNNNSNSNKCTRQISFTSSSNLLLGIQCLFSKQLNLFNNNNLNTTPSYRIAMPLDQMPMTASSLISIRHFTFSRWPNKMLLNKWMQDMVSIICNNTRLKLSNKPMSMRSWAPTC